MSDHHPFHTMLPPHRGALRRYALKLTHQEDRAEDLVQQTFLKAWAHRDKFMIGTNVRPWLFTILRNTFYSDLRKSRWEDQDVEGRLAATLSEEAPQEHAVRLKEVMVAVAALPDAQRRPLVLMSAYGYSQREAATACKCSVGTIKSRVFRARMALSQEIEIKPRPFRLHDQTGMRPPIASG